MYRGSVFEVFLAVGRVTSVIVKVGGGGAGECHLCFGDRFVVCGDGSGAGGGGG